MSATTVRRVDNGVQEQIANAGYLRLTPPSVSSSFAVAVVGAGTIYLGSVRWQWHSRPNNHRRTIVFGRATLGKSAGRARVIFAQPS